MPIRTIDQVADLKKYREEMQRDAKREISTPAKYAYFRLYKGPNDKAPRNLLLLGLVDAHVVAEIKKAGGKQVALGTYTLNETHQIVLDEPAIARECAKLLTALGLPKKVALPKGESEDDTETAEPTEKRPEISSAATSQKSAPPVVASDPVPKSVQTVEPAKSSAKPNSTSPRNDAARSLFGQRPAKSSSSSSTPAATEPASPRSETSAALDRHPAIVVARAILNGEGKTGQDGGVIRDLLRYLERTLQAALAGQDESQVPVLIGAVVRATDAIPTARRAIALENRLKRIVESLPAVTHAQGQPPTLDRIYALVETVQKHTDTEDFAGLQTQLNAIEGSIDAFEKSIASLAGSLARAGAVFSSFGEAAIPSECKQQYGELLRKLFRNQGRIQEWNNVCSKLEQAVIPSHEEMQKQQKTSAGDAAITVRKMLEAGFLTVGDVRSFYVSPDDLSPDGFGAAWSLEPTAGTGRIQWVNEWEFHIHGKAVREGGPDTAVISFTINKGHIKPSGKARELGASIDVKHVPTLTAATAAAQVKFVRWANSKNGQEALARTKR